MGLAYVRDGCVSPQGLDGNLPGVFTIDWSVVRERNSTVRREAASLRRGNRAKCDPQSGHDRERAEHRPAQSRVAFDPDCPMGLISTEPLGEELPGGLLVQGDS